MYLLVSAIDGSCDPDEKLFCSDNELSSWVGEGKGSEGFLKPGSFSLEFNFHRCRVFP